MLPTNVIKSTDESSEQNISSPNPTNIRKYILLDEFETHAKPFVLK